MTVSKRYLSVGEAAQIYSAAFGEISEQHLVRRLKDARPGDPMSIVHWKQPFPRARISIDRVSFEQAIGVVKQS